MKTCPECGQEWAPKFRFCPEDGTPLPAEAAAAPVQAPGPRTQVPATSPSQRPKAASNQRLVNLEPVAPAAPARAPSSRASARPAAPASREAQRPVQDAPTRATVKPKAPRTGTFEKPEPERPQRLVREGGRGEGARVLAPIAETDEWTPSASEKRAPSKGEHASRVAPTMLVEAVTEEMASETRQHARPKTAEKARPATREKSRPSVPRAAEAAPAKPEPKVAEKAKPAKKRRDFSETAWFMNAPDPEAADPETGKVKSKTKDYVPDETMPEAKRKQFSLRRSDED